MIAICHSEHEAASRQPTHKPTGAHSSKIISAVISAKRLSPPAFLADMFHRACSSAAVKTNASACADIQRRTELLCGFFKRPRARTCPSVFPSRLKTFSLEVNAFAPRSGAALSPAFSVSAESQDTH